MKNLVNSISIFFLLLLLSLCAFAQEKESDWKLGIQSYTFHHFTLTESIAKASQAGIKYMEAFHG
jgi:L-ribulose-5-phosphate 3-epimerase